MRYFLCRAWYASSETGRGLEHKKSNRHWAKLLKSHDSASGFLRKATQRVALGEAHD